MRRKVIKWQVIIYKSLFKKEIFKFHTKHDADHFAMKQLNRGRKVSVKGA